MAEIVKDLTLNDKCFQVDSSHTTTALWDTDKKLNTYPYFSMLENPTRRQDTNVNERQDSIDNA